MYDFWDMECDGRNFLSCQTNFCPFIPLRAPKIKIFKKIQKMPGDIIIWQMCNMNHVWLTWLTYDVSYEVWFLRYRPQRTEFFVILDHFLAFYTLTTQKSKFWKKWKKHLEIFYTCLPKIMIICYPVPEITTCDECNFYFSFWPFFCPFTPRPPSPH